MRSIPLEGFTIREIKTKPITVSELEEMFQLSGSYESLFSRRAKKYVAMGLKDQKLEEKDYKLLILSDYTFLKRPVIISGSTIFIGSDKKNIQLLKEYFKSK